MDLEKAYVTSVESLLQQEPVPDLGEAWTALETRYADLIDRVQEALVVARQRAMPVLVQCMTIETSVMAPCTRPSGLTSIALDRKEAERRFTADLAATLLLAMRVDLGLTDRATTRQVDAKIARFLAAAQSSRSAFEQVSPEWVVSNLRSYRVAALAGADEFYRCPTEDFNAYCGGMFAPNVLAQGVDAVLIVDDAREMHAMVPFDGIPVERQIHRLRQIGLTVENGFRYAPGTRGWHNGPDGAKAWFWTADSPLALVFD